MRVDIVGGGPAGLYAAILLRSRGLADQVTVYERNPPGATFGFGIVFSGSTLANLKAADEASYRRIADVSLTWTDVIVGHPDETVRIGGNDFAGVARLAFLEALQARCRELDVDLRFEAEVTDPTVLEMADLLIGADGVGSVVRDWHRDAFDPSLDERRNLYIWLGTAQRFDGLAMLFRRAPAGTFIAHAYAYGPEGSTFVVECAPETFQAAGLHERSERDALAYLADVFAEDLNGQPLMARGYRWIRFIMLQNAQWHHRNVVLLGDALHTAHFSIGSGTKLALEDAIALAEAVEAEGAIPQALARFQSTRQPPVEAYQAASLSSLKWLEHVDADLDLDPLAFAYKLMTRSGRVDDVSLSRRDPDFFAALADAGLVQAENTP